MTHTEKYHIHVAMPLRIKRQCRIADQVFVHRIDRLTRITLAVDETNVHIRMPDQQPDHFPASITGASDNACPYLSHNSILSFFVEG
jgi:hypothetical protein